MKKSLLVCSSILLIVIYLNAHPIRRAEKKMKSSDYSSAEKILEKAVLSTDYYDAAIPLLAECYRMQNNQLKAKKWYALAITLPEAKAEWYFYNAQALRSSGEYKKAKEMFLQYADLKPEDPRGLLYASYCDSVLGPWRDKFPEYVVKNVENINSPESDFGPAFYSGQLIFASERHLDMDANKYGWRGRGNIDIMNASPKATNQFWSGMKPAKLCNGKFNKSYHDGPVVFVGENLAYFTRTTRSKADISGNGRSNHLKIYYSVLNDGKWGPFQPFFLNSSEYSVGYPTLSADGNTIIFVSDMPNGYGGTDLWMCHREGTIWGAAQNLGPDVNTAENEVFPYLQSDGSLMFSSEGLPGYGGQDIFLCKFENGYWQKPENLGAPLNSSYDDFAIIYAPNDAGGFFTSNRPGGAGSDDIYAFREFENFEPAVTKLVEIH